MRKLFALIVLAGLGFSAIGCTEKKPPAAAPAPGTPSDTKEGEGKTAPTETPKEGEAK